MGITIVIPAKDAPTLPETLTSIARAAENSPQIPVHVIIVDSSKEPTNLGDDVKSCLRVAVFRKDCTRLEARVDGYLAAREEWVLNLDTDQAIHPDLLARLAASRSAAVVFPEMPPLSPPWDRWVRLVYRAHHRTDAEFRRRPSLNIPVIPRGFRTDLLKRAVESLRQDVGGDLDGLPTQHEDTIVFSYFLAANGLSLPTAIEFADIPIFNRIPSLEETGRKTLRYGRDLGVQTRRMRNGELTLNPQAWRNVHRVDARKFERLWGKGAGWEEGLYNVFRACFYLPGFLAGFLGVDDSGRARATQKATGREAPRRDDG